MPNTQRDMASAPKKKGGKSAKYQPPRAKSVNSKTNQPQTRALKKDGDPSQLQKVTSDTSLEKHFQNLTIQDGSASGSPTRHSSGGHKKPKGCEGLEDVARHILVSKAKNIIVMVGAGISTSSGIPDFRSPGTGLYDNLKQYNLPYPQAVFDIDYFEHNPKPFFQLAKELYPSGKYQPNYVHYFLRLLHEKGLLLRVYTQNIDGLERMAGLPPAKLVEAHGSFQTSQCTRCKQPQSNEAVRAAIFNDKIPRCRRRQCWGVVKPNIVFFGEDLPKRFYYYMRDFPQADLLLVLGTSLEVEPFASIVDMVRFNVPRVLFNLKAVGPFQKKRRLNDVVAQGDLVERVTQFVRVLGWKKVMTDLMESESHQQEVSQGHGEMMADETPSTSSADTSPEHHPIGQKTPNGNAEGQSSANNTSDQESCDSSPTGSSSKLTNCASNTDKTTNQVSSSESVTNGHKNPGSHKPSTNSDNVKVKPMSRTERIAHLGWNGMVKNEKLECERSSSKTAVVSNGKVLLSKRKEGLNTPPGGSPTRKIQIHSSSAKAAVNFQPILPDIPRIPKPPPAKQNSVTFRYSRTHLVQDRQADVSSSDTDESYESSSSEDD